MDAVQLLKENERKDLLRFVTAGSVDDGKSTLIGRLLYESKGIYEDQLASVKKASKTIGSAGGEVDFALVTDGLKAEREQGITIDVAYRYFSTPKRKFIIADTPGHEQYTRNMATGASTASLVIILVDAENGVATQTKRHTFIASLLGIPHVLVAVNKMDLVDYSKQVYENIREELTDFAAKLEVTDLTFIPISALKGDNVVEPGTNMPWYKGSTLLNHLETVHIASDKNLIDLRFPVQYVLRPDRTFRGYLGSVASGAIRPKDEVMVIPSGMRTRVESVFDPDNNRLDEAIPPLAVGVTLEDEVDVSRGDMLVHTHNVPRTGRQLDSMIVWMSPEPMSLDKQYIIKHTTRMIPAQISDLRYRVDVNTLHRSNDTQLRLNEIGRCVVELTQPVAYDPYQRNHATGAFVIIDRLTNNTVGAGMILDREPNEFAPSTQRLHETPKSTHVHRKESRVSLEERAERLGQTPFTVWLTGLAGSGKTSIAGALERRLFDAGKHATVIDGENARLTFNKDLGFTPDERMENARRTAEVAALLNRSGMISICALLSPHSEMRDRAREIVGAERFVEVYLSAPKDVCRQRASDDLYDKARAGEIERFSGVSAPYEPPKNPDLNVPTHEIDVEKSVDRIIALLQARGLLEM